MASYPQAITQKEIARRSGNGTAPFDRESCVAYASGTGRDFCMWIDATKEGPAWTVFVVGFYAGPHVLEFPCWEFTGAPSIAWREAMDFMAQQTTWDVAAEADDHYWFTIANQ